MNPQAKVFCVTLRSSNPELGEYRIWTGADCLAQAARLLPGALGQYAGAKGIAELACGALRCALRGEIDRLGLCANFGIEACAEWPEGFHSAAMAQGLPAGSASFAAFAACAKTHFEAALAVPARMIGPLFPAYPKERGYARSTLAECLAHSEAELIAGAAQEPCLPNRAAPRA